MPRLIFKSGPDRGRSVELKGHTIIGRGKGCDLVVVDEKASRRHCAVLFEDGKWFVSDLDSRNKTFLDGRAVAREVLEDGAEIRIGDTLLAFQIEPPRPAFVEGAEDAHTVELKGSAVFSVERVTGASRSLLEFSRRALAADSTAEVLEALVECVSEALQPDRIVPVLMTPDGPVAYQGKSTPYRRLSKLPISRTLLDKTLHSRQGLVLKTERDEREESPSIRRYGIGSVLAVPILSGEELYGALYADRLAESETFEDSDLDILEAFALMLATALTNVRLRESLSEKVSSLEAGFHEEVEIVGESEAIRRVLELTERASLLDSTILIVGESGTGKELVARSVHLSSKRRHKAFEAVNCAALTETLVESELFGHRKGAFTGAVEDKPGRFELAHGGTLFLDEISELPPTSQAKLLRAIETRTIRRIGDTQDRTVDVRLIAATNRHLPTLLKEGRFREDLLYRLKVIEIALPPLRERRSDIPLLCKHFLRHFGTKCGRPPLSLDPKALDLLCNYRWPGNVRELKNVIERAVVLCDSTEITPDLLPAEIRSRDPDAPDNRADSETLTLEEMEKRHILKVLRQANGNKAEAARLLGIDRSTLYARLKAYGIE